MPVAEMTAQKVDLISLVSKWSAMDIVTLRLLRLDTPIEHHTTDQARVAETVIALVHQVEEHQTSRHYHPDERALLNHKRTTTTIILLVV